MKCLANRKPKSPISWALLQIIALSGCSTVPTVDHVTFLNACQRRSTNEVIGYWISKNGYYHLECHKMHGMRSTSETLWALKTPADQLSRTDRQWLVQYCGQEQWKEAVYEPDEAENRVVLLWKCKETIQVGARKAPNEPLTKMSHLAEGKAAP